MALKAFTDTLLKAQKPPSAGRVELMDLRCPGLAFRITHSGVRSFSYRYRDPKSGKVARFTLGKYPDLSLAAARRTVDALREKVASGINPMEAKRKERAASASRSFEAVSERYLTEHAERKKAPRSVAEDRRLLNKHVRPKWRRRRIDDIRRSDVIELCEPLVAAGKGVLANRVQSLVSKVFSFCVEVGLIETNPCTRLSRRASEEPSTRVLSDAEIRLFWPAVLKKPVSPKSGLALRLILLTGCRPGEVAGMNRAELSNLDDPARALWLIPGSRTKNGYAHAVPLVDMARQTIAEALALVDDAEQFVFASPRSPTDPKASSKSMRPHSLTVAMKRMASKLSGEGSDTWTKEKPTPHDLRRTAATRLSSLGVPGEDVSAVLNHVKRDVTGRVYDQYRRLAEKRRALTVWATALEFILNKRQGVVVPMTRSNN